MLYVNNYKIRLTKGDSAYINFHIDGLEDFVTSEDETDPITVGEVRCQVRDKDTRDLLFEGTISATDDPAIYTWHILPEDTAEAETKEYMWDAQVKMSNDDVFTFVPVSPFIVLDEVTEEDDSGG